MTKKMRIAITGVSGRMGQRVVLAVRQHPRLLLCGASERVGHAWCGQDLGRCMGGESTGIIVVDDPIELFIDVHAVIDFTAPQASVAHAALAAQARCVHVIGTTGFTAVHLTKIKAAARHAVIIRASNMSLGVNLLCRLTEKVATALDADFDIEIIESHHRDKKDAPSGTALMLGDAAARGRKVLLADVAERGRDGLSGGRQRGNIGFSALRGGDIVGEHDIIFAANGERIILRHVATDRHIFARGAVRAALWGLDKSPGTYSMFDVLGL